MVFKKSFLFSIIIVFLMAFQLIAGALPSVVTVTDTAEMPDDVASLFNEDDIIIDIGERESASNRRYAEVCGIQMPVKENNNTYSVECGDQNLIVEITEKTEDDLKVVKTEYYYINAAKKIVTKLDLNSYMTSSDEKAIRTVGQMGVRFKSRILTSSKTSQAGLINEYGYIISTADALGSSELTFNSKKYVSGVAYSKTDGIDLIYDSTDDKYHVFTGVLRNVPVSHYETDLVCKTYTKLVFADEQFVVYGEPIIGNVFEIASQTFINDFSNVAVAKIVFDYFEYIGKANPAFENGVVSCVSDGTGIDISGSFTSTYAFADSYNVYLVEYSNLGTVISVNKSDDFTLLLGNNTFEANFEIGENTSETKAFVLTSDIKLAAAESKIFWKPAQDSFYDVLSSDAFDVNTDFSSLLDSNGNVSLIEGISLVSSLHAKKNGVRVEARENVDYEYIVEMDDASKLIDLSEKNSINIDGINFGNAEGEINEEKGYLVGTSTVKANGGYDPQVTINGLMLEARNYNKITVRMKFEPVEGGITNFRNKYIQIFFKTNVDNSLNETKSELYSLKNVSNVYDWFEFEMDMSGKEPWNNFITGIRFDPTNDLVKFYVDYIKFSKSDSVSDPLWYERFLDYAYENDIVKIGEYTEAEFEREITREEFLTMLVKALGEEEFATVNSKVSAIPDIDKNRDNAEIFLMLYKAGITLGFDENGNFNPELSLLRSDAAAIINRVFVPDNRLVGSVDAVWQNDDYINDYEFNDAKDLSQFSTTQRMTDKVVSNGAYSFTAAWDSYMVDSSVSIDADKYTKIKIRIKADYASSDNETSGKTYNVYFKPEDFDGDITHYTFSESVVDYYLDAAGWYVIEIDMCLHPKWKGNINYFRFDPMNSAGNYKIDYIRFIKSEYADYPDQESLVNAGYTATRLMQDEDFERGFYVGSVDQSVSSENHGLWQDYCETSGAPLWQIGPWWQGTGEGFEKVDLWDDRNLATDKYTLADKYGVNTIVYNPEDKSLSMRLNSTKIYNGLPHNADTYTWWPHQLLEQNTNYTGAVDKERNSADADRMFVELDIRMTDFKNTTNPEGVNSCQYLIYFYLRPKAQPSQRIWFGLQLFTTSASTSNPVGLTAPTNVKPGWSPDSAAHQYMYGMPMAVVYDGIENSFNPSVGVAAVSDEWKHIRLDVTPHIDRAVEWANRDNIFGFEVTKEDMYFDGVNIGFEVHGNYDATFEFKNFNMVAYNKD